MKRLTKLKLTQLNKVELEDRQMKTLKGGADKCGCFCVGDYCNCVTTVSDKYANIPDGGSLSDSDTEQKAYNSNYDSNYKQVINSKAEYE